MIAWLRRAWRAWFPPVGNDSDTRTVESLAAEITALQDEIIKESLAIVEESCAETGVTLSDTERDAAELGAVAGIRAAFRVLYRKGLMVEAGEAG